MRLLKKGANYVLKGQFVLAPVELKKIQKVLPRSYGKQDLISIALKRLRYKSAVFKQVIWLTAVNNALRKLKSTHFVEI